MEHGDTASLKDIKSYTKSLAQILEPGGLQVPKFQRDYSWKQEQWEELWSDVIFSTKDAGSPKEHYMGYIVLRENHEASCFDIIDGQQRLTTLSILLLAAARLVDNEVKAGVLLEHYIGKIDPRTLEVGSKLTLNKNNNELYEQLTNGERPQVETFEGTMSSKLLLEAFEYFKQKINDLLGGNDDATVQFAMDVADGMHLTCIKLLRDMNVYKIFQTLNATGKQLSMNDLLKNYLFLVLDRTNKLTEEKANELHDEWRKIEETVKDDNLTRFISVEWNRRNEFCRAKELFGEINQHLQKPEDVYAYLRILRGSSGLYAKLLDRSANKYWDKHHGKISKELKECLECLSRLKIRSPHGLMLSALEKIKDAATLNKILRVIRIISMRYNGICQKQANRQEKLYSEMAHIVFHGSFVFDEEMKRKLRDLYPLDEEFRNEFAKTQIDKNNSNKAKYILHAIERKINPNSIADINEVNLEHILPRSPTPYWKEVVPDCENYFNRLGNMMIVPKDLNRKAGNKPFAEKKQIFLFDKEGRPVSRTKLTEHVCEEYEVWNAGAIDKFQEFLAEQALKIWSIDWNKL